MTAWVWAALVGAASLITAALGDLVSEELRGWLDLVPNAILRLAATMLDPAQRETIYQDEWLPELCYILRGTESRPITRLIRGTTYAAGLLISARRIGRISDRAPRMSTDTAAGTAGATADTPTFSGLTHKNVIGRIPAATGHDLIEWLRRVESGPKFLRADERARWLNDEHGLTHGYASAIVHEYEVRRRRNRDP
jgi:hypothetical protein